MPVEVTRTASRSYRPDIDGLRAFAVLSVLVFHLNHRWLPGGFVGVDVFFVISGYVVSHSLAQVEGGSIRLSTFYARRIKRLLPALAVCALTIPFVLALVIAPIPVESTNGVFRTGITGLVGLSNMYLLRSGISYFDGDAIPNPFTHTWSLGVEEQFYLVYPLLLIFSRHLTRSRSLDRARLGLVIVLGGASLWLSFRWCAAKPTWGYFAMPSRFWELGLGAAVAFSERLGYLERAFKRPFVRGGVNVVAVALLLAAVVASSENGFPFPWALPGVIGTLLVIASGASSPTTLSRALSWGPCVYLGRLSYSLYLWHWPVICIVARLWGLSDATGVLIAIVVTGACASASYHLIEVPLRRRRKAQPFQVIAVGLTTIFLTGSAVELIRRGRFHLYAGARQDWSQDWSVREDEESLAGLHGGPGCTFRPGSEATAGLCVVAPTVPVERRLIAVGDSHAHADWPMLTAGVDAGLYELHGLYLSACTLREGLPEGDACEAYWRHVHQLLPSEVRAGDVVFLSTYFRSYPITPAVERAARKLARVVAERGGKLLIEAPLPVHDEFAFDCLPSWFSRVRPSCHKPRDKDSRERQVSLDFVSRLGATEPSVAIWDPYNLLCPGPSCEHFRDGRPLFRDDDHLSSHGARFLGPSFLAYLRDARLVAP